MESSKQVRFMELYEPVHDRFERYCKTRACGEFYYKDIMHDTLIIAYEKFDELKTKDVFLYFLFGIAVKVLSNQRKKKKPHYLENYTTEHKNIRDESKSIETQIEIKNLYIQLEKLDNITRECIILFEISGFSIKEIMVIQNLSESAVKQRLFRGRKQLTELFQINRSLK